MHESQADLEWLQETLDRSHSRAGSHLQSILRPSGRLSAGEVVSELQGVCVLHLATATRSGKPLVAPVDGLFFRARFWFCSPAHSIRFRHIRRSPYVSAAYTRGEELSILLSGSAIEIDTTDHQHRAFRDYNVEVYGESWHEWGDWGTYPYATIEPTRMVAARVGPSSAS